jgi:hypothetical protein
MLVVDARLGVVGGAVGTQAPGHSHARSLLNGFNMNILDLK